MGVLLGVEFLLIFVVYLSFGNSDDCYPVRLEVVYTRESDAYTSPAFKTRIWKKRDIAEDILQRCGLRHVSP